MWLTWNTERSKTVAIATPCAKVACSVDWTSRNEWDQNKLILSTILLLVDIAVAVAAVAAAFAVDDSLCVRLENTYGTRILENVCVFVWHQNREENAWKLTNEDGKSKKEEEKNEKNALNMDKRKKTNITTKRRGKKQSKRKRRKHTGIYCLGKEVGKT